MYKAEVEVYSDALDAVVMRHPDRKVPGVLVQGDTLYSICRSLDAALRAIDPEVSGYDAADNARERLHEMLQHYAKVLDDHGVERPYR